MLCLYYTRASCLMLFTICSVFCAIYLVQCATIVLHRRIVLCEVCAVYVGCLSRHVLGLCWLYVSVCCVCVMLLVHRAYAVLEI